MKRGLEVIGTEGVAFLDEGAWESAPEDEANAEQLHAFGEQIMRTSGENSRCARTRFQTGLPAGRGSARRFVFRRSVPA